MSRGKAPESWASSDSARRTMRGNKRKDTAPELAVRRRLHALGLRYRVDYGPVRGLRRRADIVFTRRRIAVFIDGCFWHSCPLHATHPKQNSQYWSPKLATNVERDRDTDARLRGEGWQVLRYWEHEDPDAIAADIAACWNRSATPTAGRSGPSST
ncbi:very short patch repair endonuclease [Rathayibacter sp. AY1G1]|uniref:very short patch repair endonuclease n=1 Tax=Rathayibacter sp. AY1G1 TaxID=2080564 RepID=UPI0021579AD3|nr:very short patch repair endonuclease [Rathayibacter sp. AY1G1]